MSPGRSERGIPLTHAQKLLWAGQRLAPGRPLYNMALRFDIEGALDPERFQRAWSAVVASTDGLRLTLEDGPEGPIQRALRPLPLTHVDLEPYPDPAGELETWLGIRAGEDFDLSERTGASALIRLGPKRWCWFLNQHHVVADAASMALVFAKVSEAYRGDSGIEEGPSYLEHAAAEHDDRDSPRRQEAEAFWKALALGMARPFGAVRSRPTSVCHRRPVPIDEAVRARLDTLARAPGVRGLSHDLTRTQLLTTALFVFLYRLTGRPEQAIALPVHHRMSPRARETVGLLMELFSVGIELEPNESYRSVFEKVRSSLQASLRKALPGTSSTEHLRNVPVVLNHLRARFGDFADFPTQTHWLHSGHADPAHLLRVQVHEMAGPGDWSIDIEVNASIPEAYARPLPGQLHALISAMTESFDDRIDAHRWAHTPAPQRGPKRIRGEDETVVELFERCVAASPHTPMLRDGERVWSATDLRSWAAGIAEHLRNHGIGAGDRVAVALPRSAEAVATIMGVLGSGAAYVPLDVNGPEERKRQILHDAAPKVIVSSGELRGQIPTLETEISFVVIEDIAPRAAPLAARSDGPAYVLYTSGSTGTPKGVVISHRGLQEYLQWAREPYAPEARTFALCTPLTFDLTVTSLFLPLITGGQLRIFPETSVEADLAVLEAFADPEVEVIKLTPSHLGLALRNDTEIAAPRRGRRTLILGGEALETGLARRALDGPGEVEVLNEYGPTEGVVGCMLHRFDPARDTGVTVPIGVAAENTELRVLDREGFPVPLGVPGELALSRRGLALGYLNQEAETLARFRPEPEALEGRIYLTGDEVVLRGDGLLEFLGRRDRQVKIRGHRIELGEVEATLLEHPDVERALVHAEVELVAYVVGTIEAVALRRWLRSRLPRAAVPREVVILDAIPLTANGKLDRGALPPIDGGGETHESFIAPVGPREELLARLWAGALKRSQVGREDNYFDLGGESLAALQIVAEAAGQGLEFSAAELFEAQTVAALAKTARTRTVAAPPSPESAPGAGLDRLGDRAKKQLGAALAKRRMKRR